jgi:hypothetical protein
MMLPSAAASPIHAIDGCRIDQYEGIANTFV